MSPRGAFCVLSAAGIVCVLLAGCAVGPDFGTPGAPQVGAYTAAPLPQQTAGASGPAGAAQSFVLGADIPAQWWMLFECKPLDGTIREALQNSPTLAAAQAALLEAQENWRAQYGTVWFPAADASGRAERQKFSASIFGGTAGAGGVIFNLYNASVNVSYLLDIFGGGRRELESLRAQVAYQQFQLEGAYLTLTSNLVTAAVQEASLRGQIQATEELVSLEQKQLDLVQKQFQVGGASRSDLLAQQAQLAQTQAGLPPLQKQLDQQRHLLAILAGRLPAEARLPEFTMADLRLPQQLPVSLPSDLVRQRPDIRASEALWHAACAQIGVATANLLPQVTLSGSYGSQTNKAGQLFDSNTIVWNVAGSVTQPVFHGGELVARRRAALAAYQQAAAQYRQTVLLAFQNVADALQALEADARALQAQAAALDAARASMDLTQQQFKLGAVTYLSLLTAERQYQQARVALVQAQAARLADTAVLFTALGGGWWNRSGETDN
jgi:NodT family efflux transporter outer membrane factor (OMF) lipoprotein